VCHPPKRHFSIKYIGRGKSVKTAKEQNLILYFLNVTAGMKTNLLLKATRTIIYHQKNSGWGKNSSKGPKEN